MFYYHLKFVLQNNNVITTDSSTNKDLTEASDEIHNQIIHAKKKNEFVTLSDRKKVQLINPNFITSVELEKLENDQSSANKKKD